MNFFKRKSLFLIGFVIAILFSCKKDELSFQSISETKTPVSKGDQAKVKATNVSPAEVESTVKFIMQYILVVGEDEVTYDADLVDDLGAGESEIRSIITEINRAYSLDLSGNDTEKLKTVGEWIRFVTEAVIPQYEGEHHTSEVFLPENDIPDYISIDFFCQKQVRRYDSKLVDIKDIQASSSGVEEKIYDSKSNVIKTIKVSYTFASGSWSAAYKDNVSVTWKGVVTITVEENGAKTTRKKGLSHSAIISSGLLPAEISNYWYDIPDSPGGPIDPGGQGDSSVYERMINVISDIYETDKSRIANDTNFFTDLYGDELDFIEMIQSIEAEFSLNVPDGDEEKIKTVSDLYQYINQHAE